MDDRRGTLWDWPVGLALAGLVLALIAAGNSAAGGLLFGLLVAGIGAVVWLVRRHSVGLRRR